MPAGRPRQIPTYDLDFTLDELDVELPEQIDEFDDRPG
jgi:hypothetical protein